LECLVDDVTAVPAEYVNSTLVICQIPTKTSYSSTSIKVRISSAITSTNSILLYNVQMPVITALNLTSYYLTVSEIVYVQVTGSGFGQYQGWLSSSTIYVMIDNTVINVPVSGVNAATFVFPMPLGLDLGPHTIAVSNDGANYGESEFTITVIACPDGLYCTAL
jgi:hypothetical protein